MTGTGPPDEPAYVANTTEVGSTRRPALLVTLTAVVVVALAAGITAAALLSGDSGDGLGQTTSATTDPTNTTDDGVAPDPDPDGEAVAALVPGDTLLDEWEVRNVREDPAPDLGAMAVVAPAGSTVDSERAVHLSVYPRDRTDPMPDGATEVTHGEMDGYYSGHSEEGLAVLALGDGERSTELLAASGTPLDTLTGLAVEVGLDAPIDALDPGPDWQVVTSTAELRPEVARGVELTAVEGSASLHVEVYQGVDESAMGLFALPFATRPVEVRGHEAIASTALLPMRGASMVWMERPDLLVGAWTLDLPSGPDADESLLAIAEQLEAVDADGWSEFVDTWQMVTVPDDPDDVAPGEAEIVADLDDGGTYYAGEVPGEGICVLIDWEERGCRQWVGEDPLRPAILTEPTDDGDEQPVLVYGYLAEGADTVIVTWNDARSDAARTGGRIWAAAAPSGRGVVSVAHWTDFGSAQPEKVATATYLDGTWRIESPPD